MSRHAVRCPSCQTQDLAVKRHTGVIVVAPSVTAEPRPGGVNVVALVCPACRRVATMTGYRLVLQPV